MSTNPEPCPGRSGSKRLDWLLVAGLVAACFAAYLNVISGEFVYDDMRQIVENPLIQDNRYYSKALTADVWAFRDGTGSPGSNYWRPTFTLWQILNYQIFGLENTAGWHIANILLHALVTVLSFGLLRFLGLGRGNAAAIALIFAVHPVHVESVAWISGVPDLLMAAGFLGALWLAVAASWRFDWKKHLAALLLLALSLGAKEVAIIFPVLLFLILALTDRPAGRSVPARLGFAAGLAAPYAGLGLAYFFIRLQVLGQFSLEDTSNVSLLSMALTAPHLLTFYVRQSLFPLWLGPSYELEAIELATLGVGNFWIPMAILVVAAGLTVLAMRKGNVQRIGAALFILPLLPALNIDAFIPEQIVHDRYLYLPLLGLLMVVVPTLAPTAGGALAARGDWVRATVLGLAGAWCLSLLYLTIQYNRAWLSELLLWEHAVVIAPGSAFNWTMLGFALAEQNRDQEALQALDRSLQDMTASSTPDALLKRAEIYTNQGRLEDAVIDLRRVLAGQPENVIAYEQLAIILRQAGRLNDAANILETGRQRVPSHDCEFSTNLAVVLYLSGSKNQALAELERIRGQAQGKITSGCRLALFRLGQLYIELGRASEGRAALLEYLVLTESLNDEATLRYRGHAQRQLGE